VLRVKTPADYKKFSQDGDLGEGKQDGSCQLHWLKVEYMVGLATVRLYVKADNYGDI
jgi:hypothetical protein